MIFEKFWALLGWKSWEFVEVNEVWCKVLDSYPPPGVWEMPELFKTFWCGSFCKSSSCDAFPIPKDEDVGCCLNIMVGGLQNEISMHERGHIWKKNSFMQMFIDTHTRFTVLIQLRFHWWILQWHLPSYKVLSFFWSVQQHNHPTHSVQIECWRFATVSLLWMTIL